MRLQRFFREDVAPSNNDLLIEGIQHLEDLTPEEFVQAVSNLSKLIATEKLDGANLIFGFENDGKFYTSREGKRGGRFYSVREYTKNPAHNGFKSAHAALEKIKTKLKKVITPGEAVETEVLFGRQPNAIVYGANYIAFLRMVDGDNGKEPDQSKIQRLSNVLKDVEVEVKVPITTSEDGLSLTTKDTALNWRFASTQFIDKHHFAKVNLDDELQNLRQWLEANPRTKFTTKQHLNDFIEATKKQFILPIKEKLLSTVVRKITPKLRDVSVDPYEDIGIEGIVMLDPQTGKQVKLVDKSVFTIINQFNYAIRNQIKSPVATSFLTKNSELYHSMNIPQREGRPIYNQMIYNIANIVGIPGLGNITTASKTIKKYPSPEAFVAGWTQQDVRKAKTEISHEIRVALLELRSLHQQFLENWRHYKLILKDQKEIRYTDEIRNRTLVMFAEINEELTEILGKITSARTLSDIANALYGKYLKSLG